MWQFLSPPATGEVALSFKGLSAPIHIRAKSRIDRHVARYVFADQFHLPLAPLRDGAIVVDLGANIGLTALHYASLYPSAQIIAVEMDAENAALARRNTAHLASVDVVEAAIWTTPGTLDYSIDAEPDAFSIAKKPVGAVRSVRALPIGDLLAERKVGAVDFLKMDIEGAETTVLLENNQWLDGVGEINVEVHDAAFLPICMDVLTQHGFKATKDTRHWSAVTGVR